MIVALDATMLILLFNERASAPLNQQTGAPVEKTQERITYFLNRVAKSKGSRVIVPTPALGEFLVRVDAQAATEYLAKISRIRGCFIRPFAERAAIEFAEMQRSILAERRRLKSNETETRAKAKFDQQIVAIAKVEGATAIYSDDDGLGRYAKRFGLEIVRLIDIPVPPTDAQISLDLELPQAREDNPQ